MGLQVKLVDRLQQHGSAATNKTERVFRSEMTIIRFSFLLVERFLPPNPEWRNEIDFADYPLVTGTPLTDLGHICSKDIIP